MASQMASQMDSQIGLTGVREGREIARKIFYPPLWMSYLTHIRDIKTQVTGYRSGNYI